jgi:hypothetical protein
VNNTHRKEEPTPQNPNRKAQPTPQGPIALDDLESVEFTLKEIDNSWLSILRLSELMEQHNILPSTDVATIAYFLKVASRDIEAKVEYVRTCLKEDPQ